MIEEEIEENAEEKYNLIEQIAQKISLASDKATYDEKLMKKLSQFYSGERQLTIDELKQINENLIQEQK